MVWKQVSNIRWENPVDAWEGYFIFTGNLTAGKCAGREHYCLSSKIRLETENIQDLPLALKHAWKQTRYEQPQIATTIEGMTRVYEVPNQNAVDDWISSTLVISSVANTEELCETLTSVQVPTLYYVTQSSELLLRAPHYTIDGIGMLLIWDVFLRALAFPIEEVQFGDEPARLAPVLDEVLSSPAEPSQALSDKATAAFMDYVGNLPALGPSSQVGAVPSGQCRNLEIVLSTDVTEMLIQACKNNKITVTAAVHAAYVTAIAKHAAAESETTRYTTMYEYDLRKYLPEPYNSSRYAVSVYYRILPHKLDLPASYWDMARSLNAVYQKPFKENTAEDIAIANQLARVVYNTVQSHEFQASPIPRDALVSSLGVVERKMQREFGTRVKVKDFGLSVDIVLGMSMFFLYTFCDRLTLKYCFNDKFEAPDSIQTYLDDMKDILLQELLLA